MVTTIPLYSDWMGLNEGNVFKRACICSRTYIGGGGMMKSCKVSIRMFRRLFSFFLCIIYSCLSTLYLFHPVQFVAPPPSGDLVGFVRELDSLIPKSLQNANVPGVSVALIQGRQVIWAKGYGFADVQNRVPVTSQTVFQAASISKTVTSWGVMKLVESGQLKLDAPAEKYLTRWHLPASRFDSNGVTVRRLLSHTSGLVEVEYLGYPPGESLPSLEESLANGPPAPTGLMKNTPGAKSTGGARIVLQPGKTYVYSDANYLLLELIMEEATGESFDFYMQHEVLMPLGMTNTSFARTPALTARTAIPYDVYGNRLPDFPFSELAPAGLYTTAPNLARFVASGMPGEYGEAAGRGLISPASLDLMQSPAIPIPGFDGWIYADAYGLGYFVETLPSGRRLISHMGGNLGWMCEFAAIPSTGDGVVVMTNSSAGQEVFADVLTAWTDWLRQGEVHVAYAIHLARRLFKLISFSMIVAAIILLARLIIGVFSSQRRFSGSHLPVSRMAGAAICIGVIVLYWANFHVMMQINVPSQASEMLVSVNTLGLTILTNTLFIKVPPAS